MNLKQAAQQLGVHYQTAYRWVRGGELVAVKVGNRYEISESSIEQFVNRRASLVAEPRVERSVGVRPMEGFAAELVELSVLAAEARATAQPCFDAATVLAGSRLGDAAVLRLLDGESGLLEAVSSFAAAPDDRAAVVGAIAVAGGFSPGAAPWSDVAAFGDVHVVHHMPRDLIRGLFGEEGRFAGRGLEVLAAAVAPMLVDGEFVGGLLAVKMRSHAPFGEQEIDGLREVAALCSVAHRRAEAFRRTWRSNTALRERVAGCVGLDAGRRCDLDELLDAHRAQALVSVDGSVLAETDGFRALHDVVSDGGFLGCWDASSVVDVVGGVVVQVDLDPLNGCGPGAIVSAVRAENAELAMLAVEVIAY